MLVRSSLHVLPSAKEIGVYGTELSDPEEETRASA